MFGKLFYAAAVLAAICAISCNKDNIAGGPLSDTGKTELAVGISRSVTKSSTITDDDDVKVKTLQVFVFRGDALDAYASAENVSEVSLSCTNGERSVYALVNAPDMSHISSKTALFAMKSTLSYYPEYGC